MTTPNIDGPVARTGFGAVLGYQNRGATVFKGVPYGAPTGGAGRFKPPRPPHPWAGVREALSYGDRCPQNDFPGLLHEEAIAGGTEPMSEDCLNLNVWTPALDGAARAVMVWFHGGVFSSGSGSGKRYDGVNLCLKQDVVVVTVNHRLNLFGFLHLGELIGPDYAQSGIVGMMDCVAALEWVRDNIAGFGGDPARIAIFGESGGGAKVSTLMAMPSARGLFHRAIAQSGVALTAIPPAAATGLASGLLGALGLAPGQARDLTSLPAERLLQGLGEMGMAAVFGLGPVVDGTVLPRHPFTPTAPDISADVPLIVGSNETEATFFPDCPLDLIDGAALKARLAAFTRLPEAAVDRLIGLYRSSHPGKDETYLYQLIASDWWLTADTVAEAERKAALARAPAYVYAFTRHSPARGGRLRATHTLEIPYVFDNLRLAEPLAGPATAENQGLAETMSAAWARFARTGDPNGPGLSPWPPYGTEDRTVMMFGETVEAVRDPYPDLRKAVAALKAGAAPR